MDVLPISKNWWGFTGDLKEILKTRSLKTFYGDNKVMFFDIKPMF